MIKKIISIFLIIKSMIKKKIDFFFFFGFCLFILHPPKPQVLFPSIDMSDDSSLE